MLPSAFRSRPRSLALAALALAALGLTGVIASPCAAQTAPYNLAPNSQWEIFSAEGFGPKWTQAGTGVMAAIAIAGNTVGDNVVMLKPSGPLGELRPGDLITMAGAGVDPALTLAPLRVRAITAQGQIEVAAPLGRTVAVSHAAVATPVNIGGSGAIGTGDAADGWKKSTSMPVWREDRAEDLSPGALYALAAHKDVADEEAVWTEPEVSRYRGRTLVFGVYVDQKVRGGGGTWQVFWRSNGAGGRTSVSAAAPLASGYQWLELTYAVPRDATVLEAGVMLHGARGDTYYLTDPVLTVGAAIGIDNYVKPREVFLPVVHISPITWINADIRFPTKGETTALYSATFDIYAETGGMVAPTVRLAEGSLEGVNGNPVVVGITGSRAIAWKDRRTDPILLGPIMGQYGVNVKSFAPAIVPLDGQGYARYFSGVPGDTWYNVSMDLDKFTLQ